MQEDVGGEARLLQRASAEDLGELVGAVSGLGLLVVSFLPWYSAGGENATAWQAFSVIDLVISAAAAIAALSVAIVVLFRFSVSYPVAGLRRRHRLRGPGADPDRLPPDRPAGRWGRRRDRARGSAWRRGRRHLRRLPRNAAAEAPKARQPRRAEPTSRATWVAQAMIVIIGLTPTEVGSRLASAT